MTYLHMTFKNLTLYGSRCICFKCKYKSVLGINENKNVFFSYYKLPNVTLFFSSITYLDITLKNLTLYGSRCICFKCKYKSMLGINKVVILGVRRLTGGRACLPITQGANRVGLCKKEIYYS
jgi:hypothetical protein